MPYFRPKLKQITFLVGFGSEKKVASCNFVDRVTVHTQTIQTYAEMEIKFQSHFPHQLYFPNKTISCRSDLSAPKLKALDSLGWTQFQYKSSQNAFGPFQQLMNLQSFFKPLLVQPFIGLSFKEFQLPETSPCKLRAKPYPPAESHLFMYLFMYVFHWFIYWS